MPANIISEELNSALVKLKDSAKKGKLDLPLANDLQLALYDTIGNNEISFYYRQTAFWLIGHLAKNNQILDIGRLEVNIEEALLSDDSRIRVSATRLFNILILYNDLLLDEIDKEKLPELLWKILNHSDDLEFRARLATLLSCITDNAHHVPLLIEYNEQALVDANTFEAAVLGLEHLSKFDTCFSLSEGAIQFMCEQIQTHSYSSRIQALSLMLIAQSLNFNEDELSVRAMSAVAQLIQSSDIEIIQACLLLISVHLDYAENKKSIKHAVIERIKSLAFTSPFERDAISILTRLGLKEELSEEPSYLKIADSSISPLLDEAVNQEKSLETVLSELEELNQDEPEIKKLIKGGSIKNLFESIETVTTKLNIQSWDKSNYIDWTFQIISENKALDDEVIPEILAVMKQAILLNFGYTPRHTQLLSLFTLASANTAGRLAQIATGEGKSDIVAMFAVVKLLQGQKVDIITSSSILASRDAKKYEAFYALFGITVSFNSDEINEHSAHKSCYESDIVYGALSDFQFDLLRDEYKLENQRGARPYATVIVDEVDSLLVDECGQTARLSCEIPAMDHLEPLLVAAWDQFLRINQHLFMRGEICLYQPSPEIKPSVIDNRYEFTVQLLQTFLKRLIESRDILIPNHLNEFALSQVENWAKSAVNAGLFFEANKDYVLDTNDEGEKIIAPVDYQNTGVIHPDTSWDNGVHQFLQLKHGLKITPEQLMTCYISNIAYFERYGKNIYGLTGTLGETQAQDLLKHIYPIDIVLIPTHKYKQFVEWPAILVDNHEQWLTAISQSTQELVHADRASLLLWETIHMAQEVSQTLSGHQVSGLKHYFKNEFNEQQVLSEQISNQQIIVSTNLAGRGTDIKTSASVDEQDGLHVTIGFLPNNLRVEQQAFGRTSRQGKKGTGQLIINREEAQKKLLAKYPAIGDASSIGSLRKWRDDVELMRLSEIKNYHLQRIRLQDILFTNFKKLITQLRHTNTNQSKLKEIEERWGLWLKTTTNKLYSSDELNELAILEEFKQLVINLKNEFLHSELRNPCYLVLDGNDRKNQTVLNGPDTDKKQYRFVTWSCESLLLTGDRALLQGAIESYTRAIERDPVFSYQAYYNRAHVKLLLQFGSYQHEALEDLLKAKSAIEEYLIPQLRVMQLIYANTMHMANQELFFNDQISTKIKLYLLQINHINSAISTLEKVLTHPEGGRVAVTKETSLLKLFNGEECPKQEIYELHNIGLDRLFELDNVLFDRDHDVFGIVGSAILGCIQLVLGACAVAAGSPSMGALLIEEGIADITYAAQCALGLDKFSWNAYRANKVTSVAWHVVAIGINVIKENISSLSVSKAERVVVHTVGEKQAFQQMIKDKVIASIIASSAKQVINVGLHHLSRHALAGLKPQIANHVSAILLGYFQQPHNAELLDQILSAKTIPHQKLIQITLDLVTPRTSQLSSIGLSLINNILSQDQKCLKTPTNVAEMFDVTEKITGLTNRFCRDFDNKIKFLLHQLVLPSTNLPCETSAARDKLLQNITDSIASSIMSHVYGSSPKSMLLFSNQHQINCNASYPIKSGLGLGVSAGDAIEGCGPASDHDIAKGAAPHVCKAVEGDSEQCIVAKNQWNAALKAAFHDSTYSGLSAAADSFGKAANLSHATSELKAHCQKERETFDKNRDEYSTDSRFDFESACVKINQEKKPSKLK